MILPALCKPRIRIVFRWGLVDPLSVDIEHLWAELECGVGLWELGEALFGLVVAADDVEVEHEARGAQLAGGGVVEGEAAFDGVLELVG